MLENEKHAQQLERLPEVILNGWLTDADVAAIKAGAAALRQGDQTETWTSEPWAPIDTAPKDGTRVLGFDPEEGWPEVLSWQGDKWVNSEWLGSWTPTHWMPVPTGPMRKP